MNNIPKMKIGIVAVSRDCFPESLSVNRRKALVDAYAAKYDAADIYECPVCIDRAKQPGKCAENFIPGIMPVSIIYMFEKVDIPHGNSQGL